MSGARLLPLLLGCCSVATGARDELSKHHQHTSLRHSRQDVLDAEGHRVYLAGQAGDDGTKEGLFGAYFDVPFLSDVDGHPVAKVSMQLAITPDEDHHGLMFRHSMPDSNGMLFLYPQASQKVLYMRNTLIDLDVGWVSHNGSLLETQHLYKLTETYRYSKSHEAQYGLEMNADWFASHGVQPGRAHLDMEVVARAIAARGFDPSDYGLAAAAAALGPPSDGANRTEHGSDLISLTGSVEVGGASTEDKYMRFLRG